MMKILISIFSILFVMVCFNFNAEAKDPCTLEIKIEGVIGPGTTDYIDRAISKAKNLECSSFLALINTPGGSLESTRIIVEKILNSDIPFLCLVAPQGGHAGSAGAIILQACHVNGALMATNLGAATPVAGSGQEIPKDLRNKLINDTVSWLEGVTKLRGRNLEFSKKIVDEAKAVSSEEAFKLKAIDILSDDIKGFLEKAKGRKVSINQKDHVVVVGEIESYKQDSRFHILQIFSDPQIAYLLFMGSLALLYFEFTHPGTIAPGVIGAIGLVLS
ncbi:MAG: nodulation protein NfeD, partial [Bdellovibrionota bacterium]